MSKDLSDTKDLSPEEAYEQLNSLLKEQLNVSLDEIIDNLSASVKAKSNEIAEQFFNIAPHGDYGLLLEDKKEMSNFIASEACLPQHWVLKAMVNDKNESTRFIFANDAVDDGKTFKGYVIVNSAGRILHSFAQAEE